MDFHGGSTTVYHPYLSRLSLPWYIASSWFNMDADRPLPNHWSGRYFKTNKNARRVAEF